MPCTIQGSSRHGSLRSRPGQEFPARRHQCQPLGRTCAWPGCRRAACGRGMLAAGRGGEVPPA